MAKENSGVYFSSLDDEMEGFLTEQDWKHFLLCSLLFDGPLIAPDTFFFTSEYLRKHLRAAQSGRSLFEVALKRGLIIPAFRQGSDSFTDSYVMLQKQSGFLGVLPDAMNTARRLDDLAVEEPRRLLPPSQGRNSFGEAAAEVLCCDHPPEELQADAFALSVWEISRPWRFDAYAEAQKMSLARGLSGLSRSDWLRAVAQRLGWSASEGDLSVAATINSISNHQTKRAAGLFFRWMNEIYQFCGAKTLGLRPSFLGIEASLSVVPYSLVGGGHGEIGDEIEIDVRAPSPEALVRIPPEILLSIRSSIGADYLRSVQRWQSGDPNVRAEVIQNEAKQYGRLLGVEAHAKHLSHLKVKVGVGFSLVGAAVAFAKQSGTAPDLQLVTGLMSALAGGYALHEFFAMPDHEYQLTLRQPSHDLIVP